MVIRFITAFAAIVFLATFVFAQERWRNPVSNAPQYNALLTDYEAIRQTLPENLSELEGKIDAKTLRDALDGLRALKVRVDAYEERTRARSAPAEIQVRSAAFKRQIDSDIRLLSQTNAAPPSTGIGSGDMDAVELNMRVRVLAPRARVIASFKVPRTLSGKVWIGMMRHSEDMLEPLPYSEAVTKESRYSPQVPTGTDGVIEYSAPQLAGPWDLRIYDKESGSELRTVTFQVEATIQEFRWYWSGKKASGTAGSVLFCRGGGGKNITPLVFGTGLYSDESLVCWAAVHSGKITAEEGGFIRLRFYEPSDRIVDGSERNGVRSETTRRSSPLFEINSVP